MSNDIQFLNIMLSVITGLLTLMGTSFGWWLARLSKKLDELMQHRQGCIIQFADRVGNSDDHRRIWVKLDDQERRLTTLEAVRKV